MPRAPLPSASGSLQARVLRVLEEVRPAVRDDGGDVELVEVTGDGTVKLRFKGACMDCPSRDITLQQGIERNLRKIVPEVKSVVAVD